MVQCGEKFLIHIPEYPYFVSIAEFTLHVGFLG